jgi:hypothetical protein
MAPSVAKFHQACALATGDLPAQIAQITRQKWTFALNTNHLVAFWLKKNDELVLPL